MDVYLYRAAFLCEKCGETTKSTLTPPENVNDEKTFDSDDYPKGPYPDGGGEADCPQHCDFCGVFLENPLTSDGYKYVEDQIKETVQKNVIVETWMEFYDFDIKGPM